MGKMIRFERGGSCSCKEVSHACTGGWNTVDSAATLADESTAPPNGS